MLKTHKTEKHLSLFQSTCLSCVDSRECRERNKKEKVIVERKDVLRYCTEWVR